jgi:hypothetical protein
VEGVKTANGEEWVNSRGYHTYWFSDCVKEVGGKKVVGHKAVPMFRAEWGHDLNFKTIAGGAENTKGFVELKPEAKPNLVKCPTTESLEAARKNKPMRDRREIASGKAVFKRWIRDPR